MAVPALCLHGSRRFTRGDYKFHNKTCELLQASVNHHHRFELQGRTREYLAHIDLKFENEDYALFVECN